MNESEKERLIKKDIVSIENRVRHAFNQGYEMGVKAYKENMSSRSEIPNTCGDAISRDELLKNQTVIVDDDGLAHKVVHIGRICAAPSVTPQQRTGRWVKEGQGGRYKWMCSNCGTHHKALYDYCPSCGCKMEVEE